MIFDRQFGIFFHPVLLFLMTISFLDLSKTIHKKMLAIAYEEVMQRLMNNDKPYLTLLFHFLLFAILIQARRKQLESGVAKTEEIVKTPQQKGFYFFIPKNLILTGKSTAVKAGVAAMLPPAL